MMHLLRFAEEVPHVPVPTVPVTTLNVVVGKVPLAPTVIGVAVAVSQPAWEVAVARHSTAKTVSPALKPAPVMVTDCPLLRPVDGETWTVGDDADVVVVVGVVVVVVEPPVAKVIAPVVKATPVATAPTEILHVASVAEVPHVPLPMVPVLTVKEKDTFPFASEVTSA
jgi:hypothetical protein